MVVYWILQCVILTGSPGDVTDLSISRDTTTCRFVVQWTIASSDPVCGQVFYTVVISTEGGGVFISDNTTLTNYTINETRDDTIYYVSVTASNNAGSSSNPATIMTSPNSMLIIMFMHL